MAQAGGWLTCHRAPPPTTATHGASTAGRLNSCTTGRCQHHRLSFRQAICHKSRHVPCDRAAGRRSHASGTTVFSQRADNPADEAVAEEVCMPVPNLLTPQGQALLECLVESPKQFCDRVEGELQAVADGLMDADVPSREVQAHQLDFAHDVMYCWMICEAYCDSQPVRARMLKMLRRDESGLLAEGDSRRRQLNDAKLMFSSRGKYKLGAIRFSSPKKKKERLGLEQKGAGAEDLQWKSTIMENAMTMARERAAGMYATWGRVGYVDRRMEDRARLNSMVTGKETAKRNVYDHVLGDLVNRAITGAPSNPNNDLLQVSSKEAWSALQLHAEELLQLEEGSPTDSFSSSILFNMASMTHMMEEANRCGRSLYDAEKIVSQYIPLPEWTPPQGLS